MSLPQIPDIPEFNIDREANAICQLCKEKVPIELHFVQPMFVGDRYIDVCPKCARGIHNLLKGYPRKAHLPGAGSELYFQYISWLETQRR